MAQASLLASTLFGETGSGHRQGRMESLKRDSEVEVIKELADELRAGSPGKSSPCLPWWHLF